MQFISKTFVVVSLMVFVSAEVERRQNAGPTELCLADVFSNVIPTPISAITNCGGSLTCQEMSMGGLPVGLVLNLFDFAQTCA
ncbi:uncharacterized protein FOMMEDRAFT_150942 [Fomitiporia mediterranea MF3/22]|uniref:uncharacterized protein n=1 Tax=Fomitiporia mediterranea (strain MF3/22) TaxID=694068 RepID=UPI0004408A89|nr:uncharacterized protein FOMMEDRAFT_150942 [Fomitiporia mediterranea MF3/22]EJD08219.1 hypothetical protein FOMMEDRAFT_150942 [Fomitiporia mediterranea MF3/22]